MRILQVVGGLDRGGAETWLVQVLAHVDRAKYAMDFLVHTEAPGAYDEEVRRLGAKIIPCLTPNRPLQYARNFFRGLREHGPYDVVHSHVHHFSGYVLLLAKLGGVPVRIAHSHTAHIEKDAPLLRKAYLQTMELLVRKVASHGIAVSGLAADSLFPADWRSNPKRQVSPVRIDVAPFEQPVDPVALRRELRIPVGAFVVGHVGRFVEAKNHVFLVDVAEQLLKLRPEAFFLLVGDGPLRSAIEAKVQALGIRERFLFTGVRKDVPGLMKGAMDVFFFPSLYEGLPLATIEAQAARLPCVISDTIAVEARIFPEMIIPESLSAPPKKWAESLLLASRVQKKGKEILPKIPSILQSSDELIGVYNACATESHA